MGQRFCQWNQGLCMALVACLVLCLIPGEAIICRKCRAKNDQKCRSRKRTCEETRDNAVCMVGRKYTDNQLTETFMKCTVDGLQCGVEMDIPEDKFRLELDCCSEGDFCSDDLERSSQS
ncbi:uncharacterized protein LOC132572325 isoform X2 [Heteronotia binoei]|uniref:uncharacterized protein LOC132572325 isoform X2 n=1 Tax=Heteronotia binoei TaxID=13085 RepID=UPI00292E99B8|nr:uncharacterized protein LOC132572325 isoform X2 [Heteronotia binoei]